MRNLGKHLVESGKAWRASIAAYRAAARRALLLDYDGTLVPFVGVIRKEPLEIEDGESPFDAIKEALA